MRFFSTRIIVFTIILYTISFSLTFSQRYPVKEVRAIWVATVGRLDWPKTDGASAQKSTLLNIIQSMKNANFNTVVFQVRSRGDVMYPSAIEPWAAALSNSSGIIYGTDPGYDPLQYAIDESHKLGMELHAWWNVFNVASKETAPTQYGGLPHVAKAHPDWVKPYDGSLFLDPGMPEVRAYLIKLAMEMIRKYDIDAIHFDFIRYPDASFDDAATYAKYGNGMNKNDWRRENINQFVRELYDSVMAVKPMLKVGSTPIGNYKAGVPGVGGAWYGYTDVFQDSRRWMQEKKHDYIAPQIYWAITGSYPYHLILQDWVNNGGYGRHVYGGVGAYVASVYPQISMIVDTTRYFKSQGNVFFRYDNISLGSFSAVKPNYAYPANIPSMPWKDSIPPNNIKNLIVSRSDNKTYKLTWDMPSAAGDGDSPKYFNIYRSQTPNFDRNDARNLIYISTTNSTEYTDKYASEPAQNYYYSVSALDKGNNESPLSNITSIRSLIASPVPVYPAWDAKNVSAPVTFSWNKVDGAAGYNFQISSAADFLKPLIDTVITGLNFNISNFPENSVFYWRVGSIEQGNIINFSSVYKFKTILSTPVLVYPMNSAKEIATNTDLSWNNVQGAGNYKIQISIDSNFNTINYEKTVTDIFVHLPVILENKKTYYWRVNASNNGEVSRWSEVRSFTTETISAPLLVSPANLSLEQPIAMNFKWTKAAGITKYRIQISIDTSFKNNLFADSTLIDTTINISGFKTKTLYYWHIASVSSDNQLKYSSLWNFTTLNTAPLSFKLLTPVNKDTIKLVYPRKAITFKWRRSLDPDSDAVSYNLTFRGTGLNNSIQKIKDTSFTIDFMSILSPNSTYKWFVESSDGLLLFMSDTSIFYTSPSVTDVNSKTNGIYTFSLSQNYPNPFNPVTNITYTIPSRSLVSFRVYDVLGKVVFKSADEYKESGQYNIEFNGKNLPSGIYFYRLECMGNDKLNYREMKKMILVK
jgi:uncharacterized lipoprotein YddW (UPF0748 family)